jgi:hypothetical protein
MCGDGGGGNDSKIWTDGSNSINTFRYQLIRSSQRIDMWSPSLTSLIWSVRVRLGSLI